MYDKCFLFKLKNASLFEVICDVKKKKEQLPHSIIVAEEVEAAIRHIQYLSFRFLYCKLSQLVKKKPLSKASQQ